MLKKKKKSVLLLPMLTFPNYTPEVSMQYDCQFAAERSKPASGNARNPLVLFVVSCSCYLALSPSSVASVSGDQTR